MQLDQDEFRRLQQEYGIFTIEAIASCYNNLCPKYSIDAKDFLQTKLQNESLLFCPTSSAELPLILQHFE